MKTHINILMFALLLGSCMQPQYAEKPEAPPAVETIPAQLLFSAIATRPEDKKRIDMTPSSLLYADDTVPLIHMNRDGVASLFNVNENVWGPESFLEESGKFQQSYNLLSRGWLGIAADSLKSLDLLNRGLSTFALPMVLSADQVIGVGSDFIAFYQDAELKILEIRATKASIVTPARPSVSFKSIQKCVRGCQYWGFDGSSIYTLASSSDGVWQAQNIGLVIPEGKSLLRLAGKVTLSEIGQAEFESLYGLSQDAELFRADLQAPEKRLPTWENVSVVVQQSCSPCHGSDGFDQEDVLAALKPEVLRRVDPKRTGEAGAMPPPNSIYGKSFVPGDAAIIMGWLAGKADPTNPGKPTDPTQPLPTDPNKPIAGELKKLADTYCVSCHADNQKEQWWSSRKLQVKERVESGDMPRNRQMPAAARKSLLDLVQAL